MATTASPDSPSQMPVEPPAKMATRSSGGAKGRQPSVVSDPAEQREQHEDSRDCQDHGTARGGEADDGHDGGRDPSPPGSEFPCEEREAPATAAGDAAAAAGTPRSQASRASNGPRRASGEALAANLPLGGSWEQDLLNQDSFGFNLLDHQGNLSFDLHDAAGNKGGGGGTPRSKGEGGRQQAVDWTAAVPGDVVVSGATHHWSPPYYGDGGTYGGHTAEGRDAYDDPDMFRYAFGDPAHGAGNAAAPPAKGGRGTSQASRRSKKRKQLERAEPLDGHHSPPPLPAVESAPAATLDFAPSHAGLPQSSTWGAYPYAPPVPGPPGADVPTAFLPPPPAQGGAPVGEVYVAAKGGPYGMPPYGHPDAAPSSGAGGRRSKGSSGKAKAARTHRPPPAVAPVRRGPPAPAPRGLALLRLPNGAALTRAQAPGIGWPPEEDLRLTELLSRHKGSNADWDRLARDHGHDRTARECHDRWTRYLKPGSRKGQWREEEDAVVLRAIFASGAARAAVNDRGSGTDALALDPHHPPFTQWADLAPQLPGRTGKQIRDRWVNYLNPAINHLPFSREDDLRLWQGHADLGKRWVEISVKVFGSSRSENHIKNRWYSAAFKKFVTKEFGQAAYLDAKAAQGGVIGRATMGRSAGGGGGRGHPAARMVHSHATRSQGV
ncbi:hypothetical protein ACHAXT_000267 [Thalassiosira profunda]